MVALDETPLFKSLVEVLSKIAGRSFICETELYCTANLCNKLYSPSLVRLSRQLNTPVNELYERFVPEWTESPVSIGTNGFLHFQVPEKIATSSVLPAVEAEVVGKVVCASFSDKWGTPRQGQLAPESRCKVAIPASRVGEFSDDQALVLWVPHLSQSKNPLQTLVRPPKAHGNFKCGVFATRSPHRPSPVCLSVAKIDRIAISGEQAVLHLSGCDMTQDTPILSVRPYVKTLHAVSGSRAPKWVREANTVAVVWGLGALFDLHAIFSETSEAALRLQKLVTDTLHQDPRSLHSKKQLNQPVHAVKIETSSHGLIAVTYQHLSEEVVRVLRLQQTDALGKLRTKAWLESTLKAMPFLVI